jgi:DNA mismatch repair protein MSH6
MTRPKIFNLSDNNGLPYLQITRSRHPCISNLTRNFVPNDVLIGEENRSTIVITGPNMGGKSTLLRQTAICAIMAQMGSYVPAESIEMTIVDRIFTRIGARDKYIIF